MDKRFDYYYGSETEQYSYFVLPKVLIRDERFRTLSANAKILYTILLDICSLSVKNGWVDDENRVYIIYPRQKIAEEMGCSTVTATSLTSELEKFGLISKKRRGQGQTDLIYVHNFNKLFEVEEKISEQEDNREFSEVKDSLLLEVKPSLHQEVKNPLPLEVKKSLHQEVKDSLPIEQTNINNLNNNKHNSSSSNDLSNIMALELDDDENYMRVKLQVASALEAFPATIVEAVFAELMSRGSSVTATLSPAMFFQICKNIAEYTGKISSPKRFVATCIDNMLLASSSSGGGKDPNREQRKIHGFKERNYNFAEIERMLRRN